MNNEAKTDQKISDISVPIRDMIFSISASNRTNLGFRLGTTLRHSISAVKTPTILTECPCLSARSEDCLFY